MKINIKKIPHRSRRAWPSLTAILFVLGATCSASAWDVGSVQNAFNGYRDQFLYTYPGDGYCSFKANQNQTGSDSTNSGFWESAEEIEVVEDYYYWDQAYNNGNAAADIKDLIGKLCSGFIAHEVYPSGDSDNAGKPFGSDWGPNNPFNDDLCWAAIAFARATQITNNLKWVAIAANNLDTVWGRAQIAPSGNAAANGLRQSQKDGAGNHAQANVNFGFMVASYLVEKNGGGSYKSNGNAVYNWALANLFDAATGKVDDGLDQDNGTYGKDDYSYDYGIALHAAELHGDTSQCQSMTFHLMYNFTNTNIPYNGNPFSYDGKMLNLLPDYGRTGNNSGYNGICLRGLSDALGLLGATDSKIWAQGNAFKAQQQANDDSLMWGDWNSQTQNDTSHWSWDCSAGLSALVNIAPR